MNDTEAIRTLAVGALSELLKRWSNERWITAPQIQSELTGLIAMVGQWDESLKLGASARHKAWREANPEEAAKEDERQRGWNAKHPDLARAIA